MREMRRKWVVGFGSFVQLFWWLQSSCYGKLQRAMGWVDIVRVEYFVQLFCVQKERGQEGDGNRRLRENVIFQVGGSEYVYLLREFRGGRGKGIVVVRAIILIRRLEKMGFWRKNQLQVGNGRQVEGKRLMYFFRFGFGKLGNIQLVTDLVSL